MVARQGAGEAKGLAGTSIRKYGKGAHLQMARCSNLYLQFCSVLVSSTIRTALRAFEPGLRFEHKNSRTFENRDQKITGRFGRKIPFFGLKNLRGRVLPAKPRKTRGFPVQGCSPGKPGMRGWGGDSNLRMAESKSTALPLGYAPAETETFSYSYRYNAERYGARGSRLPYVAFLSRPRWLHIA